MVTDVKPSTNHQSTTWKVTYKCLDGSEYQGTETFDAVMVCNGLVCLHQTAIIKFTCQKGGDSFDMYTHIMRHGEQNGTMTAKIRG